MTATRKSLSGRAVARLVAVSTRMRYSLLVGCSALWLGGQCLRGWVSSCASSIKEKRAPWHLCRYTICLCSFVLLYGYGSHYAYKCALYTDTRKRARAIDHELERHLHARFRERRRSASYTYIQIVCICGTLSLTNIEYEAVSSVENRAPCPAVTRQLVPRALRNGWGDDVFASII